MTLNRNRLTKRETALRGAFLAAAALLAISGVLVLGTVKARAHGNPEVRVEPNPVAFEGEVTIEGEEFEGETEVSLLLEGALGEISLGTTTTDAEGTFSLTVTLPSTAAPGGYRIRAVGPEDVATADVRIEAEAGAAPPAKHEAAVGFHRIDSIAEVAGFAGLAAALVFVGSILLLFPRREKHA